MNFWKGGNGNGNGKAHDIDPIEQAEIETKVRKEIAERKAARRIEDLKAELAQLENPKLETLPAAKAPSRPAMIATTLTPLPGIKFNEQGLAYFENRPNTLYDPTELANEIKARNGIEEPPKPIEPIKPSRPTLFAGFRKPKLEPAIYVHVIDETINLQAHSLMPNSDKLNFIDPKAVALPTKTVPAMKGVLEQMSRPMQKKSIDPRVLIGIGIAVVMAAIGLVIIYNSIIVPQQNAERSYQAQILANGGNATGIVKPGGGLFKFEPPNPFAPCPTCPGGSNDPAKSKTITHSTPPPIQGPTKTYQKDVIEYCQQFKAQSAADYDLCVMERSDTLKLKAP